MWRGPHRCLTWTTHRVRWRTAYGRPTCRTWSGRIISWRPTVRSGEWLRSGSILEQVPKPRLRGSVGRLEHLDLELDRRGEQILLTSEMAIQRRTGDTDIGRDVRDRGIVKTPALELLLRSGDDELLAVSWPTLHGNIGHGPLLFFRCRTRRISTAARTRGTAVLHHHVSSRSGLLRSARLDPSHGPASPTSVVSHYSPWCTLPAACGPAAIVARCDPDERRGIRVGIARRIGSSTGVVAASIRSSAVAAIWSNGVRTEVSGTGRRCDSGMSL